MTLDEFLEFNRRIDALTERVLDTDTPIGVIEHQLVGRDGQVIGEAAFKLREQGYRVETWNVYNDGGDVEMYLVEMAKPF